MGRHTDSAASAVAERLRHHLTAPSKLLGEGIHRLRRVVVGAAVSSLAVTSIAAVGMSLAIDHVMMEVDGVSIPATVVAGDNSSVLAMAGVTQGERVSVKQQGNRVVVNRAREVAVKNDAQLTRTWTTAPSAIAAVNEQKSHGLQAELPLSSQTVNPLPLGDTDSQVEVIHDGKSEMVTATQGLSANEVLAQHHIQVEPLDKVSLSMGDSGIAQIKVVRVKRALQEDTAVKQRPVKEIENDSMYEGQRNVIEEGSDEKTITKTFVTTEDGEVTYSAVVSTQVVSQLKEEVVEVGTKKMPAGLTVNDLASIANAGTPHPTGNKALGKEIMLSYGYAPDQFPCLEALWDRESHWNEFSLNYGSGAYGIPQALPGSKMSSAGSDWQTNPATQIRWGLNYIKGRYSSPCGALSHSNSSGWY